MSLDSFPSDLSVSTMGQRSKRAGAKQQTVLSTRRTSADVVAAPANAKHSALIEEGKRSMVANGAMPGMLETTQLVLEDLRHMSRLFHSQFQDTIPIFQPHGR